MIIEMKGDNGISVGTYELTSKDDLVALMKLNIAGRKTKKADEFVKRIKSRTRSELKTK